MSSIILFEEKNVRRAWDEATGKWLFAIVDVISVLTESSNPQVYWRVLKNRLSAEGNETVTKCNALKMTAADGKLRMTDVADTEQLLRLIQSIPSPKAEPENKHAAEARGSIAGNARKELEAKSGTRVSTKENYKMLAQGTAKVVRMTKAKRR